MRGSTTTVTPARSDLSGVQAGRGRAERGHTRAELALRALGALAVLAVGAVHIDQYYAVYYRVVPTIGTLFVLNFAGATAMGVLLLLPSERVAERLRPGAGRLVVALLALGAMALAACSFAFLFASEATTLFGFREHGYRAAIVASLAAEVATVVLLAGYLASRARR